MDQTEDMDIAINRLAGSQTPLKKIGQGFCGTVWSQDDESDNAYNREHLQLALKREDGGPGRSIVHEHQMHLQLLDTLQNTGDGDLGKFRVNFPFCKGLLRSDSPYWARILSRFPPGFEPCNALVNERIPSMPGHVRTLLFRTYHPEATSLSAAATAIDDHCLIRPYLGRRRHRLQISTTRAWPGRLVVFSLRNFPLYLDQIEQLGLPAMDYAIAMADALAFLYWTARVDANDVEFVLAPNRRSSSSVKYSPGVGSVEFQSEAFGTHALWVLDFDCCRGMAMDKTGVKQACTSFLRNDPFYPRPPNSRNATALDEQLWDTFQTRFLKTSDSILKEEDASVKQLPMLLIEEIVRSSGEKQGLMCGTASS